MNLNDLNRSEEHWEQKIAPKSIWPEKNSPKAETLLKENKKLVYKIALRYLGMGLRLDELIQAGNVGIIIALEKFDPEKGVMFSTYAFYWIQKIMQLAIEKETGFISIPVSAVNKLRRYYKASEDLSFKLGREPNISEVADVLYPKNDCEKEGYEKSVRQVLETVSCARFSQVEDISFLKNPEDISPEATFIKKQSRADLLVLLKYISERERSVIIRKLGLDGGKCETFEKIGDSLDITKQGARKIFITAISKMKKIYVAIEKDGETFKF